jgi:hypothetical protein
MRIEKILSQLNDIFKERAVKPIECISFANEVSFYIEDNKESGKCIVIKQISLGTEEEQKYFKISNENNKVIAVWAIDGCFFSIGKPPKHCDCIFFDDTAFCFAEFKLNATSLLPKAVTENREKAILQLKSMIELIRNRFSANEYTFLGYNLEAYICTPITYPNKNNSLSDYAVEFLEEFGVKLFEQNYKVFR